MSTEFWENWVSTRRQAGILEELRTAQRVARAAQRVALELAMVKRAEKIATLERERGLAPTGCRWRGCTRKALS